MLSLIKEEKGEGLVEITKQKQVTRHSSVVDHEKSELGRGDRTSARKSRTLSTRVKKR